MSPRVDVEDFILLTYLCNTLFTDDDFLGLWKNYFHF